MRNKMESVRPQGGGRMKEFFLAATRFSLTPRFSGVATRHWRSWNRLSGFLAVLCGAVQRKTAEAVESTDGRTGTPLKRGVNERLPCEYRCPPYTLSRDSREEWLSEDFGRAPKDGMCPSSRTASAKIRGDLASVCCQAPRRKLS